METIKQRETCPFLEGGGEMGELIRKHDWSQTSIGTPDRWPQALQISLGNVLNSGFPMFLFWGDDLICFYNDAFRPSLGVDGKHPAIGKKGKEVWEEIWDFIGPLISGVIETGKPVWFEDQPVPFYRNGKLEDIYWTFSYSLILDDEGMPGGVLVTCMETTQAVKARRETEETAQSLRNIILQAPIAICIFRGPQFVVEIANDAMFRFWGKSSEEVLGRPLFEGIPEAKSQGYEELMTEVLRSGLPFSASELPVMLPRNGTVQTVYINFTYQPLREDNGRVSGIMAMAMDVTEQVLIRQRIEEVVSQRTAELATANQSLLEINKELQRSNQNLEEFAHAASHDLKEPVRKIHFFTNKLKQQLSSHVTESEAQSFNRIENATQRMGNLIDDLLLYSHVSHRPHETEAVNLTEKLQRVLEDLELDVEEKRATIHVEKLPIVQGYRRQLQQLFQNLISNALKYSKGDVPPIIEIEAQEVERVGTRYHLISVKDNGIGFAQEYAEKIFQMFARLHGKAEYSGTGVGLSIVKKVVENHNGFIAVESVVNEGSVFKIYLPCDA